MPGPESMEHVWHLERHLGRFAGREGLRVLEAVAKLSPERLSPYELLITAHPDASRVGGRIGKVGRINIDQLYHPIGIGSRSRNVERGFERPRDRHVMLQRLCLVNQNVGAR